MTDDNNERIIAPEEAGDDKSLDLTLRPKRISEFIGQNNLKAGDILFIDEIHRLNRTIEEVLYPAMEDYALDIIIGKGPSARTLRLDLPHFTIIGATTKISLLSAT